MPLDARAKRFLDTLAALNPPSALSLSAAERRQSLLHLMGFNGKAEPVGDVTDRLVSGPGGPIPVRVYTPAGAGSDAELPGLIYFHGGGLVAGSLESHDPIGRGLANASGCRVVSVGYRLGPEHRFPAAVEDGCAAAASVAGSVHSLHINPRCLGICGDSAGATLAAIVCQALAGSSQTKLAFQFLLCPIMDFAGESASRREFAHGYLVDRDTLAHDLRYYLNANDDPADPRISPLRATHLERLPPTIIHTAEFDPLRDEGLAYAKLLEGAGVRTLYRCHPGMIHLFYGMRALFPYAETAYAQMGADIRSLTAAVRPQERID